MSDSILPMSARLPNEPGFEQLELHHYYRALDVLAEHKEAVEDGWYGRLMDLFRQELDLVFWDTTSTYFEGQGPEGLAEYGHSKDHRPDRRQIVVGVLMTRDGYPVAHEVFPGKTADIETFRRVLEQVKGRFHLGRVILVADRGMVSSALLGAIEAAGAGVHRRGTDAAVQAGGCGAVAAGRYHEVAPNLRVKEVRLDGVRYVICHNPEQAEHDRQAREAMARDLQEKLKDGVKALIGNRGAFRDLKSQLDIRPVYHWTEQRVRGHVMVCFLALVLEVVLRKKLAAVQSHACYVDLLRDLRRLEAVHIEVEGSAYIARTELVGCCCGTRPFRARKPLCFRAYS